MLNVILSLALLTALIGCSQNTEQVASVARESSPSAEDTCTSVSEAGFAFAKPKPVPMTFFPNIGDFNGDQKLNLGNIAIETRGNEVSLKPIPGHEMGVQVAGEKLGYFFDADNDGQDELFISEKRGIYTSYVYLYRARTESGKRKWRLDQQFAALAAGCHSEQAVFADFDNDSYTDIFLPCYTHLPNTKSYLFRNEQGKKFSDVSDMAGVSLYNVPEDLRPEGAAAVDINEDGLLDFYVASHFFINQGNLKFKDMREEMGLPRIFDEGVAFLDWNNDHHPDLALYIPNEGPRIYVFDPKANKFDQVNANFPKIKFPYTGMSLFDLNRDGKLDFVLGADTNSPDAKILLSGKEKYSCIKLDLSISDSTDVIVPGSTADFDGDGRRDISFRVMNYTKKKFGKRESGIQVFFNKSHYEKPWYKVDMRGLGMARNQYGRKIVLEKLGEEMGDQKTPIVRYVDGGSGYLAKGEYIVRFTSPMAGPHKVTAFYKDRKVSAIVKPYQTVVLTRDGKVSVEEPKQM